MFTVSKTDDVRIQGKKVDGAYGLIITDDQGVETPVKRIVSKGFAVHQPSQVLKAFENVAERTNLDVTQVIQNPSKGGLIIQAKYEGTRIVGEEHDVMVSLLTSHDGTTSTILSLYALRHVCWNQAAMISKENELHLFKTKHYRNALDIDVFEEKIADIPERVRMYNARMENLLETRLTYDNFADFYINHFNVDKESSGFDNVMEKLKSRYYHADGQDIIANDTAYKAFHCVTHAMTHGTQENSTIDQFASLSRQVKSQSVLDELLMAA